MRIAKQKVGIVCRPRSKSSTNQSHRFESCHRERDFFLFQNVQILCAAYPVPYSGVTGVLPHG